MKLANYDIEVLEDNCTGCYLCENICPTGAIVLEGPKSSAIAKVDNGKCVSCFRCVDICDDAALLSHRTETPRTFGTDPASVDQAALAALLTKTSLHPDMPGCLCAETSNREIAAAVIAGARTMEEVAIATGSQSGCLMYCFAPIHRLVTAHWGEMPGPTTKNKWYPTSQDITDIPDEVCARHETFFLAEEKRNYEAEVREAIARAFAGVPIADPAGE